MIDGEFPIDLSKIQVETDHKFLDKAAIESLLRYITILIAVQAMWSVLFDN